MVAKRMVDHEVSLQVTSQERGEIRRQVITTFLEELSGGDSQTHRYTYWVETLGDGTQIYLRRPASLHKGMDFAIVCEGFWKYKNGNDRPPQHRELAAELRTIGNRSALYQQELQKALDRVWECELPDSVIARFALLPGDLAAERALKLARWMFIEQDLAYWTGQGRQMLKKKLDHEIHNGSQALPLRVPR